MPENAENQAVVSLKQLKQIPPSKLAKLIDKVREKLKTSQTIIDMFQEYDVGLDEIDLIPICFAELEVSARTEHGIIYLNYSLLSDGDFEGDDHYLAHEIDHFLQQTTGSTPTKGSTDDSYLDNEFEQEGFQTQTKYLSETKGDDVAEQYVDKVLDHHEVEGKERKQKRKKLLELAALRSKKQVVKLANPLLKQFDGIIGITDRDEIAKIQDQQFYNLLTAEKPYTFYGNGFNPPTFLSYLMEVKVYRLRSAVYAFRNLGFMDLAALVKDYPEIATDQQTSKKVIKALEPLDVQVGKFFREAKSIVGEIYFDANSQPKGGDLFVQIDEEHFDARKISIRLSDSLSKIAATLAVIFNKLSIPEVSDYLTQISNGLLHIKSRMQQLHWSDVQPILESLDDEHQEDPEMLDLALKGEYH